MMKPNRTDCICKTWATDDAGLDALLGHHHNCPLAPDALATVRGLVREMVTGIDYWAADCDGVHPMLWPDYQKARMLGGQWPDEEETLT